MQDPTNDELSFRGIAPDDRSGAAAPHSGTAPAPAAQDAPVPSARPEHDVRHAPTAVPLDPHGSEPPAPLPAPPPEGGFSVMDQAHQPSHLPEPRPNEPQAPLPHGHAVDQALSFGGGAPGEPTAPMPTPPAVQQPQPLPPGAHAAPVPPAAPVHDGAAPQPAAPQATGTPPPAPKPRVHVEYTDGGPGADASVSPRHLVQDWLRQMVESKASDLILRSGGRPSQRLDGRISFLPGQVPGPGPMLEVLRGILGDKRMETFEETGSADAALDLDGLGRFRINAYKQMGEPAIVIRRINEDAPSLDDLHLPAEELKELALRKRGLVLVTGVAGSGKSTTLSAMIEFMNRNVERHVVTLEDPVELLFKERYCVISQREVGTDTTSFKQGLKHALRQSPDVILIGEMRDAETVLAALEAIETGHLVMSTMHTVNAAQTVDRILGFFPAERHVQIRQRMADTLAGVLSMRLVPRIGGGMVPAYELMQVTPQVRELLEEGKTTELGRVICSGMERGIVAFNDRLLDLIQGGLVELDDAMQTSDRPDELLMRLRGIQGGTRAQAKAQAGPEGEAPGHPMRRKTDQPQAQEGAAPQAMPPSPMDQGGGLRMRGTGPGGGAGY